MINRNKISVIGAGNTGATLAFLLAQKRLEMSLLLTSLNSKVCQKEKR